MVIPDNLTTDQYLRIGVRLHNRAGLAAFNCEAKSIHAKARQFAENAAHWYSADNDPAGIAGVVEGVTR